MRRTALASLVLTVPALLLPAADPPRRSSPKLASADPRDVEQARSRIRVPQGFQVTAWAAEPQLANPVAFAVDGKGRVYVAETFRLHAGVGDIRGHMSWLDDDLSCRSVADRAA